MKRREDLVGRRFNLLIVVALSPRTTNKRSYWICRCDCGRTCTVLRTCLLDGQKSCGCALAAYHLRRKVSAKPKPPRSDREYHRLSRSAEYRLWAGMIQRCTNPHRDNYARYGGAGIRVCDRWRNSFAAFLADLGRRPSPKHTLDRIRFGGNYEPGNVRWATPKEQFYNRSVSILVDIGGTQRSIYELAISTGISPYTLYGRYSKGLRGEALVYRGRYKQICSLRNEAGQFVAHSGRVVASSETGSETPLSNR